ncbi:nuclear transport factor 2 family protein [Flavobacteriaceae bacterium S0825]|uniref:nuclear transport factor 2 family protein n=1 Tax=Gaetbulibacter sp. S0825 TaxID=2720084 RepID=UPI001430829E|nr:nuclear transport factor 2 family protein [Gaetbulibacter sp. S0825]MCK0110245.1 nuclear transport factor 2 family protein [Flavobacteriaceae bacterium S0825]NIX65873.1 nuclear transport factor 2 family protein [Gaetbulibacter sp. S0825]
MYIDNIKEIENLINNYIEGIFYGNTLILVTCFSENAFVHGDLNTCEYSKSVNEYIETVKVRKSPNDLRETLKMSIIGIDILGKIAMVKLHVPMLGFNYYDYLSLFKINDEWKIVNKIFTHVDND